MAFGNNTTLIRTADTVNIVNNGFADEVANTAGATAFVFSDGDAGDKRLLDFQKNDSILNYKKIFDGNNDGIIDFGSNGILDIDRTSSKAPGSDQITLQGTTNQLRYLGVKQGMFVYADASVRLAGYTELTVGNDTRDAGAGNIKYFYDTALGLNLGQDTITNFSFGDELITTTQIFNGVFAGSALRFGDNGVLDLPGDTDAATGDQGPTHGGQIDLVGVKSLQYNGVTETAGVQYYHYSVGELYSA